MMTIQDVIRKISQDKEALGITLYPPATQLEIDILASSLNITFPTEFNEFYLFCDGFESAEDMFRILPLNEIRDYAHELEGNQFYVAEYMIYSDYWVVTLDINDGSYNISEGSFHTVLTNSFTAFLDRFLKGGVFETGGLYEWKESIIAKRPSA